MGFWEDIGKVLIPVAATIIGGPGAGAIAGTLTQGFNSSNAINNASNIASDYGTRSLELQKQMFDKSLELQEPFRQSGLLANKRILSMLGLGEDPTGEFLKNPYSEPFGMSQFQQDPGYGFRLNESLKALDRTAAARGGLLSGNAIAGATRLASQTASNEYNNAFNRYNAERQANLNERLSQLNALSPLYGGGQVAAGNQVGSTANYGSTASQGLTDIGNIRAAGEIGQANVWNNTLKNLTNYYNSSEQSSQKGMLPWG